MFDVSDRACKKSGLFSVVAGERGQEGREAGRGAPCHTAGREVIQVYVHHAYTGKHRSIWSPVDCLLCVRVLAFLLSFRRTVTDWNDAGNLPAYLCLYLSEPS